MSENVRLVRQIGEGGMGTVWLANHLGLDAEVAVKFMSPALASHPAAVERFTREAKAAAHIRHPNVVQIFDSGAQSQLADLPYMVMEYLEGQDLETRLHERGRLSLVEVALIVLQTSRALDKAHEHGIVHRDIKPENIFLCGAKGDEPFVKVLDFGIAKTANDGNVRVTNTGATLGTPSYMSPEQMLSAKNVDFRCDLWALAVVAYYGVTGKLPFEGETYGAICLAVNRGRFRLPSRIRKSVPESVDAWFRRALARDPRARFDSARDLGAAFVAAVDGVPIGERRKVTPFSARATLMGSSLTRLSRSDLGEGKRSRLAYVAVPALAAGALMAVMFTRPDLRPDLAGVVHAASVGHAEECESSKAGLGLTTRVDSAPLAPSSTAATSGAIDTSASPSTSAPAGAVTTVVLKPVTASPSGVAPAALGPSTVMPSIAPVTVWATTPKRAETARATVTKPARRHHAESAPFATPDDGASSSDPYGGGGDTPINVPPVTPSTPDPSASGPGA